MSNSRTLFPKQVTSLTQVADGVYILSFAHDVEFRAGQVVALDVEPYGEPRLYSIAGGERDVEIEILFDERPEGKLTPQLSRLRKGDTVYVSEPFGTFRCDDREAVWIAAGTGVAPFVSMVRSGAGQGKTLIQGGRWDENFYYSAVLEAVLVDRYVRCCSQQTDTRYYRGRLTAWLNDQTHLRTDVKYYLCGSAEMVVEVRDILIRKGVAFGNIVSETYF